MAKIYISYNSRDRELAQKITEGLRSRGHSILLDVDDLKPGQQLRKTLINSLKSADVMVALITENSLHSQYVISEIGSARAFTESSQKMSLIPVLFGDIPIPDIIQDLYVLKGDKSQIDLVVNKIDEAINAFIGKRAAEEQKKEEVKQSIERNAAEYIEEAIQSLIKRENSNRIISYICYILGYITLVIGVVIAIIGIESLIKQQNPSWQVYVVLAFKSLVVIGLLIACSKYAFNLGKSFMNESLKSADRIHAISFGKFYLKMYSDQVDPSDLREVFQHWNIDKGSIFSNLKADEFDPQFLEKAIEIAKVLSKSDKK